MMWSVSDEFLAAIATSHTVASRLTLVEPDGTETELDFDDATVTLDGPSQTRAALTASLSPDTPIPSETTDLLAPYGNEIRAERGVIFNDGTSEYVPLGVFRLDETAITDSGGDRPIEISALDRSARLIEAVFEVSGTVAKGTLCSDQILALVQEVYSDVSYNVAEFDAVTVTTPLLSFGAGEDRWDFCRGLAEAAQCSLYFDGLGNLRLTPLGVDPDAAFTVSEESNLLSISKVWGRDDACNRVVVIAENSGEEPVVGEAFDSDPASSTFYGPPFGRVTFTWSTEYLTGATLAEIQDKANDVARNILRQKIGTSLQVNFDALPNPALEPFDVVRLTREEMGIDTDFVLDSLTIPLGTGEMTAETRTTRVI